MTKSEQATERFKLIFIDAILDRVNNSTFERKINGVTFRSVYRIHSGLSVKDELIYTLRFYNDHNTQNRVIMYNVLRRDNVHELLKAFKAEFLNYQNGLL